MFFMKSCDDQLMFFHTTFETPHALVNEYFNWNTKPITHHIYKWIGNFFIIAFGQWLQLLLLQEMFDHH